MTPGRLENGICPFGQEISNETRPVETKDRLRQPPNPLRADACPRA